MAYILDADKVPASPGIYLMKDAGGRIIYIGKAKNIRNRIRQYYAGGRDYKTSRLVEKIEDIEFVLTDTESEAFLLESNMIKRYRPPFNIELKDQQRYTYLRITDEEYPRLTVARRLRSGRFLGKGEIFGPFTHGSSKLLTVGTLRKAFKVRICKTLPKKACLEYHLGNCGAPCEFASARAKYAENMAGLRDVLGGRKGMDEFAEGLRKKMARAAEAQEFERAIEIRDTLSRLGSLRDSQKMEYVRDAPDEDYVGIRIRDHTAHVMLLEQKHGVIRDRRRFEFDAIADNTFSNFLYQYYTTHRIPRVITASEVPERRALLESLLSEAAGFPVGIFTPSRGRRARMIRLVMKNIDLIQADGGSALMQIQESLGLEARPDTIECFDISNHGADYAVGAMSRFVNGVPEKSGYRRFRIKTVSGRDDYSMIAEVVTRRYKRIIAEARPFPDLVLLDGGKGQLGAAVDALKSLEIAIPCASLAKREEDIFVPGKKKPVALEKSSEASRILQYARDEAHRFGLAYNKSLRKIKGKNGTS